MRHHFRIVLRKNPCPTGETATQPVLHSAIRGGVSTLNYTFSHNLAANAISGTSKNSVLKIYSLSAIPRSWLLVGCTMVEV